MRILIFVAFHGGHHSNYVAALLDYFSRHPVAGRHITLAISKVHKECGDYAELIAPFEQEFDLLEIDMAEDIALSSALRSPKGLSDYLRSLTGHWRSFRDAYRTVQPDQIILPSADHLTLATAAFASGSERAALQKNDSAAIFHNGYGPGVQSLADKVKDKIYRWAQARAPWHRKYAVNPLLCAELVGEDKSRLSVCPDPVPAMTSIDRNAAANLLGADPSKKYIGFIGAMRDDRAAVQSLVDVFYAADFGDDFRLLLAGQPGPEIERFITNNARLNAGDNSALVIPRHLTTDELLAGYALCDIIAPLYKRSHALSANLLKAVVARKPVLVNDFGYSRFMVERFKVGEKFAYEDIDDGVAALKRLVAQSDQYGVSHATEKLVPFHAPDNFCAHIIGSSPENLLRWSDLYGNDGPASTNVAD